MRKNSPILHLIGAVCAYCGLWLVVPKLTFLPAIARLISEAGPFAPPDHYAFLSLAGAFVAYAPTVAFMAVQLAILYYFTKLRLNFVMLVFVFLGCALVAVALVGVTVAQSHVIERLHRLPTAREVLYIAAFYPTILRMPEILMVILAAASVGYMVSLRVTDKNLLIPVVMFAACIDLWTVTRGPVSVMMQKAPELVQAVAAPIPQAGAGSFVPRFLIGPGDFLFAGLVFAVVNRLELDGPRNFRFVFAMMSLGMLAIAAGFLDYLPALILLAVGVVGANWREFKLSRQETISIVVVAVILAATLPLVWSIVGQTRR